MPADGTGTASVEAVKVPPVRACKNLLAGRKMVPGPSRGGADEGEGEETSGSENETCLFAARPPGRKPGGLPRRRGLPGVASTAVQALMLLMATTSSRNPTLMVKEQGPSEGPRRGRRRVAEGADPDKGGGEQLAGQVGARIVPWQRRGVGSSPHAEIIKFIPTMYIF